MKEFRVLGGGPIAQGMKITDTENKINTVADFFKHLETMAEQNMSARQLFEAYKSGKLFDNFTMSVTNMTSGGNTVISVANVNNEIFGEVNTFSFTTSKKSNGTHEEFERLMRLANSPFQVEVLETKSAFVIEDFDQESDEDYYDLNDEDFEDED